MKQLSEMDKMVSGMMYNPLDEALVESRNKARDLLQGLNHSGEDQIELRRRLLAELIPQGGSGVVMQPPFYCDYGWNIRLGAGVYFNFNCVVLDVAPVVIGARSLFGPAVQIYTATHPMDYRERASGLEYGAPVTIGADVWVGGGAVICPGVTIGDRTVIGAGSVVTKDVPADVLAAGNPCRVIKQLASGE